MTAFLRSIKGVVAKRWAIVLAVGALVGLV
jgi:hypothetical protein